MRLPSPALPARLAAVGLLRVVVVILAAADLSAARDRARIEATVPTAPPSWAVLERHLLDQLSAAAIEFASRYMAPDGSLIWRTTGTARFDDLPESFHNWPILYAIGGDDRLKALAFRAWNGTLAQLERFGSTRDEFPKQLDWFHIIEGLLLFHNLALADPDDAANKDRARRYADLYTGPPNYDVRLRMIVSPVTGSDGPLSGQAGRASPYRWSAGMSSYGLPLEGLPGIRGYDDLKVEDNARRMGQAIQERMMRGDVPANLAATALVTHAWLLTGDERYAEWVRQYTSAWIERARGNGGIVPDNIGPSGKAGELHGGRWWGGYYGWRWPHGYYNIGMALQGAAENARLASNGDPRYLELPRSTMDRVLAAGRNYRGAFLVPFKRRDAGWFAFQPMDLSFPAALWAESLDPADWARLERIRMASRTDWHKATGTPFPSDGRTGRPEPMADCWFCDLYGRADWNEVIETRTKEDRGHEGPWLRFLAGANRAYPETILRQSLSQAAGRLRWIRDGRILRVYDPRVEEAKTPADIRNADPHHWHTVNPVTTEALLQLTGGVPSPVYNAGLAQAHLRYFDPGRRRPGLPPDIAALVHKAGAEGIEFELVNISAFHSREVIVQAGMYGQNQFTRVQFDERADQDPAQPQHSLIPQPKSVIRTRDVEAAWLAVSLPPATGIRLKAGIRRFVRRPGYRFPF